MCLVIHPTVDFTNALHGVEPDCAEAGVVACCEDVGKGVIERHIRTVPYGIGNLADWISCFIALSCLLFIPSIPVPFLRVKWWTSGKRLDERLVEFINLIIGIGIGS